MSAQPLSHAVAPAPAWEPVLVEPVFERRTRRRQAVLACVALSYLVAVLAGMVTAVSLLVDLGPAPLLTLGAAGALALAAGVVLAVDRVLARRVPAAPVLRAVEG